MMEKHIVPLFTHSIYLTKQPLTYTHTYTQIDRYKYIHYNNNNFCYSTRFNEVWEYPNENGLTLTRTCAKEKLHV